jgi:hypothetical protein
MDSDRVLTEVIAMKAEIENKVEGIDFETKYSFLFEKAPTIFNIVKSNDHDYLPMLMYMIKAAKQISDGDVDKEETEKEIGLVLADKYLNPILDKLNAKETDLIN